MDHDTPPTLVFPLNSTKAILQECEEIGRVQSAAVELIGRCSAALLRVVLDEMDGDLSVDRLRQVIDEDDSFECLRGAFAKVKSSTDDKKKTAGGILDSGKQRAKQPTNRRKRAAKPSNNSNKRHAPKGALAEAKEVAADEGLEASEHMHPDTKIVPDEDEYD